MERSDTVRPKGMDADAPRPEPFSVLRPAELPALPRQERWLVEQIWSEGGCGILAGEPKVGKSILALHMAICIVTGTPLFGRFHVKRPGPVVLYPAEDALHIVRERLVSIAGHLKSDIAAINDVRVIDAPKLALETERDRARLAATVQKEKPRLLILDPFVRLHTGDENAAATVAHLLGYLRGLQREHGCAVLVVHHFRKGNRKMRAGQALRGSSDFHAWGDSNLYIRNDDRGVVASVEHRASAGIERLELRLAQADDGSVLGHEVVDPGAPPDQVAAPVDADRALAVGGDLTQGVTSAIRSARLTTVKAIAKAVRARVADVGACLEVLKAGGQVAKRDGVYVVL